MSVSHQRDWLSWMLSEMASARGVPKCSTGRPISYIEWPASWKTEKRLLMKPEGRMRVVMRLSWGCIAVEKG